MVIATKAIVLSSLKFGDSDLIVKCFTASSGLKSYLLRNILKSKKGKLKVSLFQPLTILEIEASHKNKGNLERIKEAKVYYSYQTLHTQIVKSSMTIFIAEISTSYIMYIITQMCYFVNPFVNKLKHLSRLKFTNGSYFSINLRVSGHIMVSDMFLDSRSMNLNMALRITTVSKLISSCSHNFTTRGCALSLALNK